MAGVEERSPRRRPPVQHTSIDTLPAYEASRVRQELEDRGFCVVPQLLAMEGAAIKSASAEHEDTLRVATSGGGREVHAVYEKDEIKANPFNAGGWFVEICVAQCFDPDPHVQRADNAALSRG